MSDDPFQPPQSSLVEPVPDAALLQRGSASERRARRTAMLMIAIGALVLFFIGRDVSSGATAPEDVRYTVVAAAMLSVSGGLGLFLLQRWGGVAGVFALALLAFTYRTLVSAVFAAAIAVAVAVSWNNVVFTEEYRRALEAKPRAWKDPRPLINPIEVWVIVVFGFWVIWTLIVAPAKTR